MPEGDTVHKLVAAFGPALEGRKLSQLWMRHRPALERFGGAPIVEVAAHGKNFLFCLAAADAEWLLHVHLGMYGKWFRGTREEMRGADVQLVTDAVSLVCVRTARLRLLPRRALASDPLLSRLGPDLLAERVDLEEVIRRARRREPRSLSDLLLDQRVAAGVGNEYKSEVLFLQGLSPRRLVSDLDDAELIALFQCARRLMQQNLGPWRRTTTFDPRDSSPASRPLADVSRLWVYGRAGEKCLRCSSRIRVARLGDDARPTYWCPTCQTDSARACASGPGAEAFDLEVRG